jgi:ankyrin repeat protein
LIISGAEQDDQGITPLHLACEYNIAPIVENMLRLLSSESLSQQDETFSDATNSMSKAEALDLRDRKGFRALHHCCISDATNASKKIPHD